ncbi:MAG TPA: (d)CMP kinase, partial [Chlamydiales bacterium]|nr:(d)CMP kinase [Chlamydiales bacterium]
MIIAIDGPSGTGKSTVAKGVARKLSFTFFDTGAMYRSLAWWLLQRQIDLENKAAIEEKLPSFRYEIKSDGDDRKYFVDGQDVTRAIRNHEISAAASKIAAYPEVRKAIVQIQRQFGRRGNAVFEGRDMGTVVFPEAEVKVFLTATPECRAQRRYRELLGKFPDLEETFSLPQILKDIQERDQNDTTRAASPLRQAADAILIDTSNLTAEEVIQKIVRLGRQKFHKKHRYQHVFYFAVYWITRIYFKLFFRLKIYGQEHFRSGAAIIAANHASHFDPPVVSISCPEEVHFLARDSLFRNPLFGFLIRHLNAHPVTRDAADAHTFRLIISLLQKGQKVILFPEGKRTSDGQLQPIERGLPFLAIKAR